MKEQLLDL